MKRETQSGTPLANNTGEHNSDDESEKHDNDTATVVSTTQIDKFQHTRLVKNEMLKASILPPMFG